MKMTMKYAAILVFAAMIFTSCNRPQLTGTWVDQPYEEVSDTTASGQSFDDAFSVSESGFTLLDDGTVLPINMGYREYYQWEKSGDMLILKGKYTGMNLHEFVDTMKIVEVTKESLCLEDLGGNSVTFKRK